MTGRTALKDVRYKRSIDPVRVDGRDIDSCIAELTGEAAQQRAKPADPHLLHLAPEPWQETPTVSEDATYYDRPVLKESVWSIDIPLYYFLGGAAGASLALGAAAQLSAEPELRRFSKYAHWVGIAGSTFGAGFLVHDLGRPSRFLHMVRVFRPTSPMNVGSWILGIAAPTAITTGMFINREGILGTIGEVTGYTSGLFGLGLATYTGVLVSNSAVPAWQEGRRWMPVLFGASAMASASSILELFHENKRANRVTFVSGNVARVMELTAAKLVEKAASQTDTVGHPFKQGATGLLWKGASALTASSIVVSVLPKKSRKKRIAAGVLGVLGSLAMRFAVHYITNASARNPRATFHQQRARLEPAAADNT